MTFQQIISKLKRYSYSLLVVYFITFVCTYSVFNFEKWTKEKGVINHDVISYYGYLPSYFIYDDISLSFLDNAGPNDHFLIWCETTDEGKKVFRYTMGLSILYSPFFGVGHGAAHLLNYDTGGYSPPYKLAIQLSCVFYFFIGMLCLRRLLLSFFNDESTAITIFCLGMCTNLYNYTCSNVPISHTYSFSLIAIFLLVTHRWFAFPNKRLINSIYLGVLIGIITLIRPSNIIVTLVFLLWDTRSIQSVGAQISLFLKEYKNILLILIFGTISIAPQFFYWKETTGHWFYNSYQDEGIFFWGSPKILQGLFSFTNGAIIYSPILITAFIGIIFLKKLKTHLTLPLSVFISLNLYVIFSWWCWWYSGLGIRPLIDSYAIMAIPMCAFIESVFDFNRLLKPITFVFVGILAGLGIYNDMLYHYAILPHQGMTFDAYKEVFGTTDKSKTFESLIRHPDMDMAMAGKYTYEINKNDTLSIFYGGENENKKNQYPFTKLTLEQGHKLSSTAFDGKKSIVSSDTVPISFKWKGIASDQYHASVWIKARSDSKVTLSIKTDNFNKLSFLPIPRWYKRFTFKEKGLDKFNTKVWRRIELTFTVPPHLNRKYFHCEIFNPEEEEITFDNFELNRVFK